MATKVYIVYYSMYGHVDKLAQEIQKGASSVEGVEAKLWQVPETLPAEEFLDATGGLWQQQKLVGKPAGLFTSTASQGGGQETTLLTAVTQLAHHGMLFVPTCYGSGHGMYEMEKVKGGSPYGAGTLAGQGTRMPSELELEQAFFQGKHIATIAKKLKASD
ncbi:hypothetical protein LUZ60_017478 [Juncus effusus]|nr:hypothetical protein LUZ60_017478 [Juncus effusus]